MKKIVLMLVIIFALTISCDKKIKKEQFHTCAVYTYEFEWGKLNKRSRKLVGVSKYNTKGIITDSCVIEYCGNRTYLKHFTKYDKNGRCIEEKTYNVYTKDTVTEYTWKWDDKGKCIEYVDLKDTTKHIYKWDNHGNFIEEIDYLANDSIASRWVNEYDNKNNPIRRYEINSDGVSHTLNIWKYDKNNNCIEETDLMGCTKKHLYDKKGNKKSTLYYWDEGLAGWSKYIRNEERNEIETRDYNEYGEYIGSSFERYDDKGNLIYEQDYGDDSDFRSYKYDKNGNKIEIVNYYNDGSISDKTYIKYNNEGKILKEVIYNASNRPIKKTVYFYLK